MSTEITKLNISTYKPIADVNQELTTVEKSAKDDYYFLALTKRFAPKDSALMHVEKKDVINGTVADEITKIQNETEQIQNIVNTNTATTLNSVVNSENSQETLNAKTIGFVTYGGGTKLNTTTDKTNILNNIQYSNADEKAVVEGAIDVMTNWLDNYITNHEAEVNQGTANGEQELKLSMLLEIRKAIENCDFPIGFGDYSDPEDEYTLGSYSFALGGYDQFYHLNTYRSILLNAKYLMPERNYQSSQDIIDAIIANPDTEFYYTDFVTASDEAYFNYCTNYMASVLIHEFVHSMHIYNEAVTYYVNDCFDDDFYNTAVSGVDQELLDTYFGGITVTYGTLGISNELNSFEEAVEHGHDKNLAYQGLYVDKGFTIDDDRAELRNFAYNA